MTPEPAKRRFGLWIAVAAVLALIVGVGVGFAAAQPSKNDAIEQRDAAEAQVTQSQQDLETAQANVAADDAAHIKCEKAATDAKDLIAQHENLWADFATYMSTPVGSAAEAQIRSHMDEQQQTMMAQRDVVDADLEACVAAITSS